MRYLRGITYVVACVAALMLAGCGGGAKEKSATTTAGGPTEGFIPGKAAPAFTLKDVDGKAVTLADYKGKVVMVDFWATWCGPCKMELPHLVELQKQYADKNFVILGLSMDEDPPATVKKFAQDNGIPYTIVMSDQDTQSKYGVTGYPTAFVIDKAGVIRNVFQGYTDKAILDNAIRPLL